MRGMLRLIGIVLAIGLADSANPATVAPALVLATETEGARAVGRFTLGVFIVYLAGGLIIALGPGQLLLALVPHPSHVTKGILELVAGAIVLAGGCLLWHHRERLAQRKLPSFGGGFESSGGSESTGGSEGSEGSGDDGAGDREGGIRRRGPALLGGAITVVELPTAFPLFAVIAAIVGSGDPVWQQVMLLALYAVCFVAPLLGIVILLWRFGAGAAPHIARARAWLQAHWPKLLAVLAIAAGAISLTLGATLLGAQSHTRLGRLLRRVRG